MFEKLWHSQNQKNNLKTFKNLDILSAQWTLRNNVFITNGILAKHSQNTLLLAGLWNGKFPWMLRVLHRDANKEPLFFTHEDVIKSLLVNIVNIWNANAWKYEPHQSFFSYSPVRSSKTSKLSSFALYMLLVLQLLSSRVTQETHHPAQRSSQKQSKQSSPDSSTPVIKAF